MILFIKLIAIKNGSTIRLMIISVFIWIIIIELKEIIEIYKLIISNKSNGLSF